MVAEKTMDRTEQLRAGIAPGQTGVEIGLWFNPIVPRAAGYATLVLDVFDADTLRRTAQQDPNIPDASVGLIEEVDFVGSVHLLDEMVRQRGLAGRLDYVVSSHNLEHFPDPIRFLTACEAILRPGGVLNLALPDRRTCFDYFRANSQTGEWLEAYWQQRTRPTPSQIFSHIALGSLNTIDGVDRSGWGRADAVDRLRLMEQLSEAHRIAEEAALDPTTPYRDTHCWCFTPVSFEAILYDLRALGIVSLSIASMTTPGGHEFFVQLVNDGGQPPPLAADEIRAERTRRQHAIVAYERG